MIYYKACYTNWTITKVEGERIDDRILSIQTERKDKAQVLQFRSNLWSYENSFIEAKIALTERLQSELVEVNKRTEELSRLAVKVKALEP